MHIVILGANGQVGSVLAQTALNRNHFVTGVTRSSLPQVLEHERAKLVHGDVNDDSFLSQVIRDADVVVNAIRPADGNEEALVPGSLAIERACREQDVRLVVSGGAGSLPISDEPSAPRTIETEYVQDAWRAIAEASTLQYDSLMEQSPSGNWTYVAPPAYLSDGPARGSFRTSATSLITDSTGNSELSWADFSMLLIQEIEKPSGHRRITGGY